MSNMIVSFSLDQINDLNCFTLMQNPYWNKFWCYRNICVGFKESKDNLGVLFGKN